MFSPSLETVRKSSTQAWDFLTRPSPSITDPQTRQQSRLLASMLLAAILTIFLIILFSTQTGNTLAGAGLWLVVSVGLMVMVWVAYVLTRRGYYQFALTGVL